MTKLAIAGIELLAVNAEGSRYEGRLARFHVACSRLRTPRSQLWRAVLENEGWTRRGYGATAEEACAALNARLARSAAEERRLLREGFSGPRPEPPPAPGCTRRPFGAGPATSAPVYRRFARRCLRCGVPVHSGFWSGL